MIDDLHAINVAPDEERRAISIDQQRLISAIQSGNVDAVRAAHHSGADLQANANAAINQAVAEGRLEILRYLHQNGAPIAACQIGTLLTAAARDHVATLEYAHQMGRELDQSDLARLLAQADLSDAVRCRSYLIAAGGVLYPDILAAAATRNLIAAASSHDPALLSLLQSRGADLRAEGDAALNTAVVHGDIDSLRYLHQGGVPLNACRLDALIAATASGHLSTLQYVHQMGFRLDGSDLARLLQAAFSSDTHACIAYLVAAGAAARREEQRALIAYHTRCALAAAEAGDIDRLRSAHQSGGDIRSEADLPLNRATRSGKLATVQYLHRNGAPIAACGFDALCGAVAGDHFDVLRYHHEMGLSLDRDRLDSLLAVAAANDAINCFQYLIGLHARPEAHDARVIRAALQAKAWRVQDYLSVKKPSLILRDLQREGADAPGSMEREVLIFVHLAKTAGTSFNTVLAELFAEYEIFDGNGAGRLATAVGTTDLDWLVDQLLSLDEGRWKALRLIAGHVPIGIRQFVAKPTRLVTLLRDPVERAVSNFEYVAQRRIVEDVPKDANIVDYVRRGRFHCWFSNAQLRVLSGDAELDPVDPRHLIKVDQVKAPTRQDVDRTLRMLQSEGAILGLVDEQEAFIERLGAYLGPNVRASLPKRNINEKRTSIDALPEDVRQAIAVANGMDIALYDAVRAALRPGDCIRA